MVEVFKTNVQEREQSMRLFYVLAEAFPSVKINFDLSDCDRVLRVEGDKLEARRIIRLVNQVGFQCEPLDP